MAWSAKSYLLAEVIPRFAPGRSYRWHAAGATCARRHRACWVLGAISWHRWSHLYMRRACWVLGAISWHRYSGTATHEGDERVSTREKRARAMHDKGEAFQCLTSSLLILVLPPSPSLPPPSSFFPSSLTPSLLPSLPHTLAPFPPSLLPFPPSLHSSLILLLAREAAGPPASQPPQRRGGPQRLGGHGPGSAVKLG